MVDTLRVDTYFLFIKCQDTDEDQMTVNGWIHITFDASLVLSTRFY